MGLNINKTIIGGKLKIHKQTAHNKQLMPQYNQKSINLTKNRNMTVKKVLFKPNKYQKQNKGTDVMKLKTGKTKKLNLALRQGVKEHKNTHPNSSKLDTRIIPKERDIDKAQVSKNVSYFVLDYSKQMNDVNEFQKRLEELKRKML